VSEVEVGEEEVQLTVTTKLTTNIVNKESSLINFIGFYLLTKLKVID